MFTIILLLIIGFALLIKGADFLVGGAVSISERLRVSAVIIGLTVVAFGTSTPELAVNIVSALNPAASDIGLGNIVGSNIANIGLIIGVSALIFPLTVKRVIITREIPFMFLSAVVFLVLASDLELGGAGPNSLTAGDGIIFLAFFIIFLYYLTSTILGQRQGALEEEFEKEFKKPKKTISLFRGIIYVIIGLAALIFGGRLVVDNAAILARMAGISEILIGLTIVAVGTSLPELATSAVAAFKKEPDIAVGNIVGSNIFNTFFILGTNAVISPIPFKNQWFADALVMIGFSALLFVLSMTAQKIKRWEGLLMIVAYTTYIIYIGIRG